MKDAPDLQTVEGLCAVPGFIDKYITTKIPSEGKDDELRTASETQTYTHVRKMVDVGVGLIISSNPVLKPV